jgi:tripartite-type tricarboxylate transporter receptor subunit TctC
MHGYFLKGESLKVIFVVLLLLTPLFLETAVAKEVYPDRPITAVVPWGAGGMTDSVARAISKAAEKELGQTIIIENKAGASGVIGLNYVLKAKPDGYTVVITTSSAYFMVPHSHGVPFNPLTDVNDIVPICKFDHGLAVRSDSRWKTYEDVVKYAKENPNKFTYSCAGVGVTQHICMERMAIKEGIKWTMVPFKSGAEAVAAILGGHTDGTAQGSLEILPHINSGKVKLLLSLNDFRWKGAPEAPTILEKGYSFYAWSFISVLGPKGLPEPIKQKLEEAFTKARRAPSFVDVMNQFKIEASTMTGKEHAEFWRSRYAEMGKLIEDLGLKGK